MATGSIRQLYVQRILVGLRIDGDRIDPQFARGLMIRQAISPRLAIRIRLNMRPLSGLRRANPAELAADNRRLLQYCLTARVSTARHKKIGELPCHSGANCF